MIRRSSIGFRTCHSLARSTFLSSWPVTDQICSLRTLSDIGESLPGDEKERLMESSGAGIRPTILTGVAAADGNSEYLALLGDDAAACLKGSLGIVGVDMRFFELLCLSSVLLSRLLLPDFRLSNVLLLRARRLEDSFAARLRVTMSLSSSLRFGI